MSELAKPPLMPPPPPPLLDGWRTAAERTLNEQ